MKRFLITSFLLLVKAVAYEQVLLEDKDGQQIVNNFYDNFQRSDKIALIKLNTGDQSLGFNYFTSTVLHDPANYQVHEFGIKVKSTEGFGPVFTNGQFSPGIHLEYSFTQVALLKNSTDYVDWGGINVSYDLNIYPMYKRDTAFSNQFFSKNFKALSIYGNYNALIKTKLILNFKTGYTRMNNYNELETVEGQDISAMIDPITGTERQIIKKQSAKEGNFNEFDAFPLIIALTKATPTDDISTTTGVANAKKLKIGYTVYLKNIATKTNLPNTTAGIIFFLTKQDKNGVRSPVFGLNLQAADPFDIQKLNNGLQNRISAGFTTVFSL